MLDNLTKLQKNIKFKIGLEKHGSLHFLEITICKRENSKYFGIADGKRVYNSSHKYNLNRLFNSIKG